MFPIPFNFPFRKKDGSLITIDDAISSGGGGGYTLPTASAETKGGIKIGSGLSMSGEVLNNSNPTPYVLPTASAETKGGVKIGNGLSMDGELLNNANPTPYTLPTASAETKGGVKVGSGLSIADGVLSSPSKWVDVTNQITFAQGVALQEGGVFKNGDIILCSMRVKVTTQPFVYGTAFTLPENLRPSRSLLVAGVTQDLVAEGGSEHYTNLNTHYIRPTGNVETSKFVSNYSLDVAWYDFVLVLNHNIPD